MTLESSKVLLKCLLPYSIKLFIIFLKGISFGHSTFTMKINNIKNVKEYYKYNFGALVCMCCSLNVF